MFELSRIFNTIKKKMMSGFLLIIFLFLGSGIYNYVTLDKLNGDIQDITEDQLPRLLISDEITLNMVERTSLLRGYLLYGDASFKDEFNDTIEESIELENEVLAINDSEEVKDLMAKKMSWGEATDKVFAAYDAGNTSEAMEIMQTEVKPLEDEIVVGFKTLGEEIESDLYTYGETLYDGSSQAVILQISFILLFVVISVLVANNGSNRISRPVQELMKHMDALASGDLSKENIEVTISDEIGQLMHSTNKMSENTKGLIDQIRRVSQTVSNQSEELTESADEVKAGTAQVAVTMEELAQGSETQANSASDLTVVMESFMHKIDGINASGEQIQQHSNTVLEKTDSGSQLMQSSREQMATIDHIVKDAFEKMKALDDQTQEISRLVAVIRDIADQTNLLALNAAIEAARAGEHGSGFAVVADEVRKLAEQVSLSVNDITGFISTIQSDSTVVANSLEDGYKEVEQGTEQIETTGETFNEISSFVTNMVENITTVSDNLSDIVANSQEMNSSIADIASVSEEAAAGVEETAASAEQSSSSMEEVAGRSAELAKLADELNELLHQFKL